MFTEMPELVRENLADVVAARAKNYDHHYRTAGWKAQRWTKEQIESSLAYALYVTEGGNLNGNEIQYGLKSLGVRDSQAVKILDYCCGTGVTAIYFALCGAEVWAFDASSEAIDIAIRSSELSGVSQRTHFSVRDAQSLPYETNFFDAAFCQSALHIVIDYPNCPCELSRVLKPGGKAAFCEEGLGYNPLLRPVRALRRRKYAQCGGRPLVYPDIERFGMPFARTHIEHFNLLTQMKTVFRGQLDQRGGLRPWTRRLLRAAEKIDHLLLSAVPCLQRYCGAVVVVYTK
jgi:SAM-dependent methyltransferase